MSKLRKKHTWVFELTVDETWVEDGFNPDAFQMKEAIRGSMLGYAYDHEVRVKLVKKANQKAVAKAQGYRTVKAMKERDGRRYNVA